MQISAYNAKKAHKFKNQIVYEKSQRFTRIKHTLY